MIPMGKPLLPKAETLLPYLKKIDDKRWYSNYGPLVQEYEKVMAAVMGCEVIAVSSGTSGMIVSLLALGVKEARMSLPSWTFVATANAVASVGKKIVFMDTDSRTWESNADIGVSPFGGPVKYPHIMIDAAGAFDTYASGVNAVGKTPVVISTHCTKTFSTGEGGLILSTDKDFIRRARQLVNHGYAEDRSVAAPGVNAKMSEYHAAIGLASLDSWKETRTAWRNVKLKYCSAFSDFVGSTPMFNCRWVGSIFGIKLEKPAQDVMDKLKEKGIATRKVWGEGCHRYKAFEDCSRTDLTITKILAERVLFLPCSVDMTEGDIDYIAKSVKEEL